MKNDDKGMTRKQLAADMKADRKQMSTLKTKKRGSPSKPVPERSVRTVLSKY